VFLGFSPKPRSLFSKGLPHFRVVIGTLVFFHQLFPLLVVFESVSPSKFLGTIGRRSENLKKKKAEEP
jgi:hypothetical protein